MVFSERSIEERQQQLSEAREQLKEEFIGIDGVIDRLVDSLASWYMYPNLQDKPNVTCLWGLTGTGKSSLILRLRQLLGMEERFFRLDLGESNEKLKEFLEKIHDIGSGEPFFLCLDEFQHAKSIEEGKEREKEQLRILWEVLDNGSFQIQKHERAIARISSIRQILDYLLDRGMVIEDGLVVDGKELHQKYFPLGPLHVSRGGNVPDESPFVLDNEHLEDIMNILEDRYTTVLEVEQEVCEMNGSELSAFLKRVVDEGQIPKTVDCRKAFFCILGNLDEAYSIGEDHDGECDPDKLHERSLRINIPEVKEALRKRFRSEQVARLGNNHILYPSFSRESFHRIIEQELQRIASKVYWEEGFEMEVEDSVNEAVYEEGVFPTQGTRPVYSTIQQMVDTRLGSIIGEAKTCSEAIKKFILRVEGKELLVKLLSNGGKEEGELRFTIHQDIRELKNPEKDDKQALCATHEAGHAVTSMLLTNTVPDSVVSRSIKKGRDGFTSLPYREEPLTKNELDQHGKMLFGGMVAEEMVFGQEETTPGSFDDLQRATELALRMQKSFGLGDVPGSFYDNEMMEHGLFLKDDGSINAKTKARLSEWKEATRRCLRENWCLFIQIADRLSEERKLDRDTLLELVRKNDPTLHQHLKQEEQTPHPFRERLKQRAEEVKTDSYQVSGNGSPNGQAHKEGPASSIPPNGR